MAGTANTLATLSDELALLVARAAASIVGVESGGRLPSSGIHWRPGVVVTAEEVLERDDGITVTLPGGRQLAATLAGRDPSTDVAVLRLEANGLAVAKTATAGGLKSGQLALAIGSHDGMPVSSLGIVAYAGGPWQSQRGGTIEALIRLDLGLSPVAEGGAFVDGEGRVVGMAVTGPRRRVLAIPAETIDRSVDQLLAKGYVGRGYLGAGLKPVRLAQRAAGAGEERSGVLIVSLDPDGPAARAGLLIGDIVTAWDAKPVGRVREVMRLLGPDSIGKEVRLTLLRGGAPAEIKIIIGERKLA
ncbi:MAG: serine protease [Proteobacteria bacterium]|nr:serine protease [Pseudomonadota bacterium]MBI3498698.1 serine protease [Pseudomonadota bacterium]